jgi:hypothetical protein
MKRGDHIHGDFKKARNPKFHNKFFALLDVGFELWEPGEIDSKWGKPQKDFDQYREQITILAGHYETVFKLDGTFKLKAKSISFANMGDEEFAQLYSNVINVILANLGQSKYSEQDIREYADKVVNFA